MCLEMLLLLYDTAFDTLRVASQAQGFFQSCAVAFHHRAKEGTLSLTVNSEVFLFEDRLVTSDHSDKQLEGMFSQLMIFSWNIINKE